MNKLLFFVLCAFVVIAPAWCGDNEKRKSLTIGDLMNDPKKYTTEIEELFKSLPSINPTIEYIEISEISEGSDDEKFS